VGPLCRVGNGGDFRRLTCPAQGRHHYVPADDDDEGDRVLLADDHAMIRGGPRLILEDQSDIDVVAEAAGGTGAVRLARQRRTTVPAAFHGRVTR